MTCKCASGVSFHVISSTLAEACYVRESTLIVAANIACYIARRILQFVAL